jgi:PadR family transcriptional regulator, regulatory protein PadR
MSREELSIVHPTLDVLVLKTLAWGPRHGYAIARWLAEAARQELQVEDRALYVALHRLEQRGLVTSEWGQSENNRRAKYYALTEEGRRELKAQTARWTRYAAVVTRVLHTA